MALEDECNFRLLDGIVVASSDVYYDVLSQIVKGLMFSPISSHECFKLEH